MPGGVLQGLGQGLASVGPIVQDWLQNRQAREQQAFQNALRSQEEARQQQALEIQRQTEQRLREAMEAQRAQQTASVAETQRMNFLEGLKAHPTGPVPLETYEAAKRHGFAGFFEPPGELSFQIPGVKRPAESITYAGPQGDTTVHVPEGWQQDPQTERVPTAPTFKGTSDLQALLTRLLADQSQFNQRMTQDQSQFQASMAERMLDNARDERRLDLLERGGTMGVAKRAIRNVPAAEDGRPGQRVYFSDGTSEFVPGAPSAGERRELADFEGLFNDLRDVRARLENNPDALSKMGPIEGRLRNLGNQTGVWTDREFDQVASRLASIRDRIIYLRSGKAINEAEAKRLLESLATAETSPALALDRIGEIERQLTAAHAARLRNFGLDAAGSDTVPPSRPAVGTMMNHNGRPVVIKGYDAAGNPIVEPFSMSTR